MHYSHKVLRFINEFTKHVCTIFQGDLDYIKYWSSVEKEDKNHVVANVQEGLKALEKDHTIMFIYEDQLRAHLNSQRIRTFGSVGKHRGWIFTKNSPLVPLFKQAAMRMLENGEFRRVKSKFNGQDIISREITDELEILGQIYHKHDI